MRFVLLLGGALLLAGSAALLYLLSQPQSIAPPPPPPRSVAAAPDEAPAPPPRRIAAASIGRDLPGGTLLRREDVSWTELAPGADPTGLLVRGVIADDELFGSALRRPAKSGEMITNEMIVRPGDRGFLASVLAPGNVAVSFNLAQSSVVSGLLQPGDRADVILLQTFGQEPALSPRRASSETILTNVRIVSIDQRLLATPIRVADDPRPAGVGGHDPRAVRTVTVELTQANAERLLLAAELGRLDLVLRSNESASVPARVAPTWADSASSALNPQNRQGINATNEVPLPMLIYRREKVERVDVGGPNLRGGQNQQ